MDLKELRYLRVIVESGTLCKAAAHLRIAQPALTRQVQKLEHDLGVQLLHRSTRGVTATPAGAVLIERTARLEHEIDDIRREVSNFAERVTGNLNVAIQYPLSILMSPDLLARYRNALPDVKVHVVENVSRSITDWLLSGQLDVAVVDSPSHEHADLAILPLWIETLHLVGPPGSRFLQPFANGQATIKDIAALPLIMPSRNHALRRLTEMAFGRAKMQFRPAQEIDGAATICELVRRGMGYTLMPPCGYYALEEAGELISVDVQPSIRRVVSIVTRAELLKDMKAATFIDMVKEAAPALAGSKQLGPARLYQEARGVGCLNTGQDAMVGIG